MKTRSATIGCSRFARNASINTGGQRIYGYPEGFELELRVISDADSHELDSQPIHADATDAPDTWSSTSRISRRPRC